MIVKINSKEFKIKTAISKSDTVKGMMGKKFDSTYNGMLFFVSSGFHCFWMKDCLEFLDIIFIKDNKISRIYNNCPPCKTKDCKNYCGEGNLILELPGLTCQRFKINEGDSINIE